MAKKKVPAKPDEKVDEKNLHVKPTKDELKKGMEEALEELDSPESEEPEVEEEDQSEPVDEVSEDYKKKFVESSKEAMILHHKNKKTMQAIDQAMTIPEPTEEELEKEYSDWEVMSDFEKKMAKESMWNARRFNQLESIQKENRDVERWVGKVDDFITDPKTLNDFPSLEGKEEDFRLFASRPTRKGSDFDVLVGAFLYEQSREVSQPKRSMFDTGTGGQPGKPKTDNKLSLDESRALMQTDYNKWRRLLMEGRITTEV